MQKGKLEDLMAGSLPAQIQQSSSNRFSANFHSHSLSRRKSINLILRPLFEDLSSWFSPIEEQYDDEQLDEEDNDNDHEEDNDEDTESFSSVFRTSIAMTDSQNSKLKKCMHFSWEIWVVLLMQVFLSWEKEISHTMRLTPWCCIPFLLLYFFDKFVVV